MEKVLSVLHEIDFFEEQVCLLPTQAFLREELLRGLLQLIVCTLDLFDVDLLLLFYKWSLVKKFKKLLTSFISWNQPCTIDCCSADIALSE